jgi:CxxC-x17-CxxC domain-containing protein
LEKNIMGFDRPRSGGFGRDRDGGGRGGFGRGGGFGGGRGGGFRDRGPVEMHDAVCDKCKKECQVPFKPSEGKPVLCSECFSNAGGSRREMSSSGGGMSQEQFKQINTKLDKIIEILDSLEVEEDEDGEDLVEDDDEDDVVSDEDEKNKSTKGLVEDEEEDDDLDEDEDKEDSEEDEKVVI